MYVKAGEPYTMPLRWNNPHSSELEVNGEPRAVLRKAALPRLRVCRRARVLAGRAAGLTQRHVSLRVVWIMDKKYVVPIRKPACSGEGRGLWLPMSVAACATQLDAYNAPRVAFQALVGHH